MNYMNVLKSVHSFFLSSIPILLIVLILSKMFPAFLLQLHVPPV
jgi:hypothetical protein